MKNNIQDLNKYLSSIDQNPESAIHFMNCPNKMEILFDFLRSTVVHYQGYALNNAQDLEARVKDIYLYLDGQWHNKTWPAHEVHFHTNFGSYVNCTYTCASELAECTEKILKEKFCA